MPWPPHLPTKAALYLIFSVALPTCAFAASDADDPTRPVTSFDLRPHFEDDTVTSRNERISLIFRGNAKWDLQGNWQIAARGDLPLVFSNSATSANPGNNYREGVGRPLAAAYLADTLDDRIAFAFGGQLRAPASGSAFGSGNWEVLPFLAARYMLPELEQGSYFVPVVRYAVSFAQSFASRHTSNLQISPQLKLILPDNWFLVVFPSPDIRINFGEKASGQTGRLFFPIDVSAGRDLGNSSVISFEVSQPIVASYPVYRFKIEARLSVQL